MRFLNKKTTIDFMGKRLAAFVLSGILIVSSIVVLATVDLNYGLDFTGGTLIEVSFPTAPEISEVRSNLTSAGLDNAVVQTFGAATDIVVDIAVQGEEDVCIDFNIIVIHACDFTECKRVQFAIGLDPFNLQAAVKALIGCAVCVD